VLKALKLLTFFTFITVYRPNDQTWSHTDVVSKGAGCYVSRPPFITRPTQPSTL